MRVQLSIVRVEFLAILVAQRSAPSVVQVLHPGAEFLSATCLREELLHRCKVVLRRLSASSLQLLESEVQLVVVERCLGVPEAEP